MIKKVSILFHPSLFPRNLEDQWESWSDPGMLAALQFPTEVLAKYYGNREGCSLKSACEGFSELFSLYNFAGFKLSSAMGTAGRMSAFIQKKDGVIYCTLSFHMPHEKNGFYKVKVGFDQFGGEAISVEDSPTDYKK